MAWRADGEMYGHTPAQVIGFASETADLEDAERVSGSHHPGVHPAGVHPWLQHFGHLVRCRG
jgi:hypothetical protein